jgi:hypothetical protein
VGSALPHILQPLRQVPVNEALGGEGDYSVFHARLQEVANLDMRMFADMLRNHTLKLAFYGDDVHVVCLFFSLTVEQYDQTASAAPGPVRPSVH